MTKTIQREILIPQPREQVWRGLTDSTALAEWMFPNDFEPRVGHHFTFQVPPNPKVGFDGLVVHCEVLSANRPAGSPSRGKPVDSSVRGSASGSSRTARVRVSSSSIRASTSPSRGSNRHSGVPSSVG